MIKRLLLLFTLSAGLLLAAPISGFGDPLLHPSLTGGEQESFDAVATGSYSSYTSGALTISGLDGSFDIGPEYGGVFNNIGQSVYNGGDGIPSQFRFDFAGGVSAFGFNWGASDNFWELTMFAIGGTLLEQILLNQTFGSNAGDYFGATGENIAYATLVNTRIGNDFNDWVFIDRITWVPAGSSSVPDSSSTLALFSLSLGMMAAFRRRLFRQTIRPGSRR
jgi:hypothetical protein